MSALKKSDPMPMIIFSGVPYLVTMPRTFSVEEISRCLAVGRSYLSPHSYMSPMEVRRADNSDKFSLGAGGKF